MLTFTNFVIYFEYSRHSGAASTLFQLNMESSEKNREILLIWALHMPTSFYGRQPKSSPD